MISKQEPPQWPRYIYYGHHKCASMWICSILKQSCSAIGLRFDQAANSRLDYLGLTRTQFIQNNKLDFFGYTTAHPDAVNEFKSAIGLHVIRDPRDISVSAYFSHRYSHPIKGHTTGVAAIRADLEKLNLEDGLLKTIQDSRQQFEEMALWNYSQENILEIKMESLTQNPYQGFLDVFTFLGLLNEERFIKPSSKSGLLTRLSHKVKNTLFQAKSMPQITPICLLGIVYANRFTEKSHGRIPGEEDPNSHYRKGIAGDWINYFQPAHIAYFKKYYNDVLIKLGYETTSNW